MGDSADWNDTRADLAARQQAAREMGGFDRLAKQRRVDRLDARARVHALLDEGSFREIGTLVGEVPSDAIITGTGLIDGRPVMVGAEDFTVLAGSIGAGSNAKRYRIAELALQEKVPLIMLLEGAGHRAGEHGVRSPTDLMMQAKCSGVVPVVTAIVGPSAGHGALIAPMSDFTLMSPHGAVFTAGPPVVKDSLGEDVTKEQLGGPSVALASGLIHNLAESDREVAEQIRIYLSFFPSSAWSYPTVRPTNDPTTRSTEAIFDIVPRNGRQGYDMSEVITCVVDDGSWFEVQPKFGRAIVCALARIGGHPVAVIANQPMVLAGSVDADAADKAAHFIDVADAFHLPLVFLADNPGMLPGSASERAGVLRSGARMFAAQTRARVPKVHLTLRKAYGFGSMVMSLPAFDGQTATFGYPGATLGAMGASAFAESLGSDADESERLRRLETDASMRSAERFGFDELIDPVDTRRHIGAALSLALNRRQVPAAPRQMSAVMP